MTRPTQALFLETALSPASGNSVANRHSSRSQVAHQPEDAKASAKMPPQIDNQSFAVLQRRNSRVKFARDIDPQHTGENRRLEISDLAFQSGKADATRLSIRLPSRPWVRYCDVDEDLAAVSSLDCNRASGPVPAKNPVRIEIIDVGSLPLAKLPASMFTLFFSFVGTFRSCRYQELYLRLDLADLTVL